ncbi:unnamed protein product [Rotaria magnacalcarata]|uniref:Uncharacterized protein n=1 Tax=Rotaria magnacalcarata TaxID=392030 RepID=A0A815U8I9_9BILA|nr:unnamed protein product [Rotaria magnacalcarata]CAF1510602.1 unnamed protein product [Rotaria magnacalcarata]CAF4055390.1 unnamed protein product [Rotaria magnacalcarata]CAF4088519.1 unnamed protein product [Rotaria magnacalcarata]
MGLPGVRNRVFFAVFYVIPEDRNEYGRMFESSEDTKPELKLNDVVQVVYDDGKLYDAKLVRFDSTTNKYKVKYTNRQYGYEWTIVDRILKV